MSKNVHCQIALSVNLHFLGNCAFLIMLQALPVYSITSVNSRCCTRLLNLALLLMFILGFSEFCLGDAYVLLSC